MRYLDSIQMCQARLGVQPVVEEAVRVQVNCPNSFEIEYETTCISEATEEKIDRLMETQSVQATLSSFFENYGGTLVFVSSYSKMESDPLENVVSNYFNLIASLNHSYSCFNQARQLFSQASQEAQIELYWHFM